jgi:deazaflavin-dependent oxidoreductase (nitroreductase family)
MSQQMAPMERAALRFFASRFGTWIILAILTPIDRVLLRLSNGRLSSTALAMPSLNLISIGAKSGQPRETPLIYLPDGERIVLIASNGGQPNHPAWYYNLLAHPQASVVTGGQTRAFRAREASGAEREDLWRRAASRYPGYETYKLRASGRTIPVMVLEPA